MIYLLMFFFSVFLFFFYGSHYVFLLLLIEFMMLSVFLLFSSNIMVSFGLSSLFILILVMVCMGGFSISVLVGMTRFFGRDSWVMGRIF